MNARPATPAPQPPTNPSSQGLNANELFDHDDLEGAGLRTRIIPPGSLRALPRISEQPTDPRRAAVSRDSGTSNGVLVFAAIVALLLGAVGGAFIFRSMNAPPPPVAASVVRFSLSADRPVTVWLGKQQLGSTPVSVFVPSGRHLLELHEEEAGTRRSLEVNLPSDQAEANMVVTLDSLPQLP